MPTNLEIKARIDSIQRSEQIATSHGAVFSGILNQTDTYFEVLRGRLKLREITLNAAELIFYNRSELTSKRMSEFQIFSVSDANTLKEILLKVLPLRGVVKKQRRLYMYGTSRIHLDVVEGLGCFLEFEVPIKSTQEEAIKVCNLLIDAFEIQKENFIKESYIDLILAS